MRGSNSFATAFVLLLLLAPASTHGAGGGGGGGGIGSGGAEEPTGSRAYEKIARKKYDRGLRYVERALEIEKNADAQETPERREELLGRARSEYDRALRQFDSALSRQSDLHEVHSDRGFVLRKLGDYQGALASYDTALAIESDYAPAIEYRGEAYLLLGRLDEAKQSYLSLASDEPELAGRLLSKMKEWLARQRAASEGHDPAAVEAFGAWVAERARIARSIPFEADASADVAPFRW